jgi:hypothetical protein
MLKAPPRRPLCLLCDYEVSPTSRPAGLAFLIPNRDDPRHGILSAICPRCCAKSDLQGCVLTAYQAVVPDLRLLPPLAGVGRA